VHSCRLGAPKRACEVALQRVPEIACYRAVVIGLGLCVFGSLVTSTTARAQPPPTPDAARANAEREGAYPSDALARGKEGSGHLAGDRRQRWRGQGSRGRRIERRFRARPGCYRCSHAMAIHSRRCRMACRSRVRSAFPSTSISRSTARPNTRCRFLHLRHRCPAQSRGPHRSPRRRRPLPRMSRAFAARISRQPRGLRTITWTSRSYRWCRTPTQPSCSSWPPESCSPTRAAKAMPSRCSAWLRCA